MSDQDRRLFAAPPASGEYHDVDLAVLDPADPDQRRLLILAEHPDLDRAIRAGRGEIHREGEALSPTLHIAMHEIVATQLWDNEPPDMWLTPQRLIDAGYDRHEILHMLASVVSADVYNALHHHQPHDPARTRDALAALPESWERQRADIPAQRHMNREQRRAEQRRHRH
jgi:hypothetical protein